MKKHMSTSSEDNVKPAFPGSTAENAPLRKLMTSESHSMEAAKVDALPKAS
jgi:hypothetical protein